MDATAQKLQEWLSAEMHFRPSGLHQRELKSSDLQSLCRGQLKDVWSYLTKHVKSTKTVQQIRGNLVLAQQQSYEGEFGAQHSQLMAEVAAATTAVGHVGGEIKRLHADISSAELKIRQREQTLSQERHRSALLRVRSKHIHEKVAIIKELTARVDAKRNALESQQNQTKPRLVTIESHSHPENACTREVKAICFKMETFIKDLLDGKFGADKDARDQQKTESMRALEVVLQKHSLHQFLMSLRACCHDSTLDMRQSTSVIDIHRDLQNLQFSYSSNNGKLTDISSPPSLLMSVRQLLQESHQSNIQRFIRSEESRNRAWKLQKTLPQCQETIAKMLEEQLSAHPQALDLARRLFEAELQLATCRSSVRVLNEVNVELKEQMAEAMRNKEILISKFQRIQDFRKIADAKQNLIRFLVKQNIGAQTRLECHQAEVSQYVQKALTSKQADITQGTTQLKDYLLREMESFALLNLSLLMLVSVDGLHKTSASDLSIARFESKQNSSLRTIAAAVGYAYHQSPELLSSALVDLCRDANAHTKANKRSDSVPSAEHISGLCHSVRAHDEKVLKTVVPVLQTSLAKTTQALTECLQLKDTVSHWWEQPAQTLVPWLSVDDASLQQWRDRWTVNVTRLRQTQVSQS